MAWSDHPIRLLAALSFVTALGIHATVMFARNPSGLFAAGGGFHLTALAFVGAAGVLWAVHRSQNGLPIFDAIFPVHQVRGEDRQKARPGAGLAVTAVMVVLALSVLMFVRAPTGSADSSFEPNSGDLPLGYWNESIAISPVSTLLGPSQATATIPEGVGRAVFAFTAQGSFQVTIEVFDGEWRSRGTSSAEDGSVRSVAVDGSRVRLTLAAGSTYQGEIGWESAFWA